MGFVDTTTMADVQSREVSWIWQDYFPLGTVTVMLGNGGLGKSFATLAIASAVTNGTALPGDVAHLPPSDVIVQNVENPLSTVVKPRLEMLGADCSRVHIINENERRLTLDDDRIEEAIIQHNARLTLLDPLQSFLGSASMNRAENMRAMLTHLEQVAERTNSALLIVGHLNKGRGNAAYRGLGSIDIYNSVPSVLYLGEVEDDVRAIVHGKSNLGELGVPQAFRLSKDSGFEWLGECDVTLDELINSKSSGGSKGQKLEEAMQFIKDLLSNDKVPSAEAIEETKQAGISNITRERAKKKLGVKAKNIEGHWYWIL